MCLYLRLCVYISNVVLQESSCPRVFKRKFDLDRHEQVHTKKIKVSN